MKKQTTIWTYLKRALLVVVLLVLVVFLSVYFLDVYKVSANIGDYNNEYEDSYWENLEENGFVSYEELKELADIEYKEAENLTQISKYKDMFIVNPATYKLPYDENADDITKIKSARFADDLEYIYKLVTESAGFVSTPEFEEAYALMLDKLTGVTRLDYLDSLSNKLVLSSDKYDLYFDSTTTQFVLKEKDANGEVISSWSSTPDDADDKNTYQKSIFTITCVDGNKAVTKTPIVYDSYSYSCQKNLDNAVIPTFSVNVVKDSEGNAEKILVYYTLEKKGIDSTYIPSRISLPRLRELIQRCNKLVAEYKAENNGEYAKDSSGLNITELGFYLKLMVIILQQENLLIKIQRIFIVLLLIIALNV